MTNIVTILERFDSYAMVIGLRVKWWLVRFRWVRVRLRGGMEQRGGGGRGRRAGYIYQWVLGGKKFCKKNPRDCGEETLEDETCT